MQITLSQYARLVKNASLADLYAERDRLLPHVNTGMNLERIRFNIVVKEIRSRLG